MNRGLTLTRIASELYSVSQPGAMKLELSGQAAMMIIVKTREGKIRIPTLSGRLYASVPLAVDAIYQYLMRTGLYIRGIWEIRRAG
jgi:hypothetical protein